MRMKIRFNLYGGGIFSLNIFFLALFFFSYGGYVILFIGKDFLYFIGAVLEFLIFTLLYAGNNLNRFLYTFIYIILLNISLSQLVYYRFSLSFISTLALSNSETVGALNFNSGMVIPFLILNVISLPLFILKTRYDIGKLWTTTLLVFFISGSLYTLQQNDLNRGIKFPVVDFFHQLYKTNFTSDKLSKVGDNELVKGFFYKSLGNNQVESFPKRPNIIVFFTEGLSARWIDRYNESNLHPNLTPHLDHFIDESMIVTNYYNHTAATFRGLRGQLMSGYQLADENGTAGISEMGDIKSYLIKNKATYLPDVLRNLSYKTYFFSPHIEGMNINKTLRSFGFDKVYTANDFLTNPRGPLTDEQLISSLEKNMANINGSFFIGIYNFGTHMLQDSNKIKYKDGASPVLNRIHEWDSNVGNFFDWFKKSKYYDNTIVIFTTDHSTFPGQEVLAVEKVTPNVFVDKIPLIIHWQGIKHIVINAAGRNSLSLAPTIMSMLHINNVKNTFLGCSIFEKKCWLPANISAIGEYEFLTSENGVYYKDDIPKEKIPEFKEMDKTIKKFYTISN